MTVLPSPIPHPLDALPWDVPGWVYTGLEWVLGVEWPEGNEKEVWDLADMWFSMAAALTGPRDDASTASVEVLNGYGHTGQVGAAFDQAWRRVAEGDEAPLVLLLAIGDDLGKLVEECGCDIEAAKIEVWIEVGILVVELLALAVAVAMTAGAASPAAAGAMTATRFAIQRIFKKLLAQMAKKALKAGAKEAAEKAAKEVAERGLKGFARKAGIAGLKEAGEEVAIDLGTQTYQNTTGRRDGLDFRSLGMSAAGGFAGGAVTPLAGLGGHASSRAGRFGENVAREMGGELLAENAASLATGGGLTSLEDGARAATSGAAGSLVSQSRAAMDANLDARLGALSGFTDSAGIPSAPLLDQGLPATGGPAGPASAPRFDGLTGSSTSSGGSSSDGGYSSTSSGGSSLDGGSSPGGSSSGGSLSTDPTLGGPRWADPTSGGSPSTSTSATTGSGFGGLPSAPRVDTSTLGLAGATALAEPPGTTTYGGDGPAFGASVSTGTGPAAPPSGGSAPGTGAIDSGPSALAGSGPSTSIGAGHSAGPTPFSSTAVTGAGHQTTPGGGSQATAPTGLPSARPGSVPTPVAGAPVPPVAVSGSATASASSVASTRSVPTPPVSGPVKAPSVSAPSSVSPTQSTLSAPAAALGASTVELSPDEKPFAHVPSTPNAPVELFASTSVSAVDPVVAAASVSVVDPVVARPADLPPPAAQPTVATSPTAVSPEDYHAYHQDQRNRYESNRRLQAAALPQRYAATYQAQAEQFAAEADRLERVGDREGARYYRDARLRAQSLSKDWSQNADEVLAGTIAPRTVAITDDTDFRRINEDVGVLVAGPVETGHRSALSGSDDPPSADRLRPYGKRYGHRYPLAQHQIDVERSMPRGADGAVVRTADPRQGDWFNVVNDGGPEADPARGINCVDCSLSLFESWMHGRPRVSAPRTQDLYASGNVNRPLGGERGGAGRIEDVTGGRFQLLSVSTKKMDPRATQREVQQGYDALQGQLLAGGHGSFAFLLTTWEGGGGHSWVAVNQNGTILYLDPQMRIISENTPPYQHSGSPNRNNVVHLDALVVGPDGRPLPLPGKARGLASLRPPLPPQPSGPVHPIDMKPAEGAAARPGPAEVQSGRPGPADAAPIGPTDPSTPEATRPLAPAATRPRPDTNGWLDRLRVLDPGPSIGAERMPSATAPDRPTGLAGAPGLDFGSVPPASSTAGQSGDSADDPADLAAWNAELDARAASVAGNTSPVPPGPEGVALADRFGDLPSPSNLNVSGGTFSQILERLPQPSDGSLIEQVGNQSVATYLNELGTHRARQFRNARERSADGRTPAAGAISRKSIGNVSAVAVDRRTGAIAEGVNGRSGRTIPMDELHPLLCERLGRLRANGPYPAWNKDGPALDENGEPVLQEFPFYDQPLGHAEVRAVNELLWIREREGYAVDESAFVELRVDNFQPFVREDAEQIECCPNCHALLLGAPSNAGRYLKLPKTPENRLPE